MLCDTLAEAEDAAVLSFILLENETIVAEKSSYTVTDGDAFTDGVGRKVCTAIADNYRSVQGDYSTRKQGVGTSSVFRSLLLRLIPA